MNFYLLIAFLIASGLLFTQSPSSVSKHSDLKQALDDGVVEVDIFGLFGIDQYTSPHGTGFYYGECMALKIRNISDSILHVYMPVGTYLLCDDTTTQNMVVTKGFNFYLRPKQISQYRFYAMCGEKSDAGPDKNSHYTIYGLASSDIVKVATVIEELNRQDHIGQYAMWAVTDGATYPELNSTSHNKDLVAVKEILTFGQIPTRLNDSLRAESKGFDAAADAVEIDKQTTFYNMPWLPLAICGNITLAILIFVLLARPGLSKN